MLPPNCSSKLLKSFDLILNHTIDNRDDTIILKLIDQVRVSLHNEYIHSVVVNYIHTDIFEKSSELRDKEPEVQQFCLNLINCVLTVNKDDLFELKTLFLIEKLLAEDFSELDSGTLCSILDLCVKINLNDKLKQILFNKDSVSHFIDPNLRSIYVRRHFKNLLSKHLDEFKEVLENLSEDLKIPNLDLFYAGGIKVEGLESKTELVDLSSIQHFSYMVIQGLGQKLDDFISNFGTRHDLKFKFLIYSFEVMRGQEIENEIMKQFFAPFKIRNEIMEPIFKFYVHNLKLMSKKFPDWANLSHYVEPKDFVYCLKSLNLDSKNKKFILDFLIEYFENKENDYLTKLNDELTEFMFEIEPHLALTCFKLCSLEPRRIDDIIQFLDRGTVDIEIFVNFCIYVLKKSENKRELVAKISNLISKCLNILTNLGNTELKETIFELLDMLPEYDSGLFTNDFLYKIQMLALGETEAFLRRDYMKFLSKIFSFKKTNMEFFSYFLLNDYDWQCQLYCLDFFNSFYDNFESIDLNQYQAVLNSINDSDQQVVKSSCELILSLKNNEQFNQKLNGIDVQESIFKFDHISSLKNDLVKLYSLEVAVSGCDDLRVNFINEYKSLDIDYLKQKLEISNQSSDIYSMNPVGILDDIISAYQFDWDEEKAVDCY